MPLNLLLKMENSICASLIKDIDIIRRLPSRMQEGISEQHLDLIFNRFYKADCLSQGRGD